MQNECAVGGRFEREVAAADGGGDGSAAGQLPYPMFPQVRALLIHALS